MIVIATHNGNNFLKNLLIDIENFNIPNNKVCIVDNGSNNETFLTYLDNLKTENYIVLRNEKSKYCLGALSTALDYGLKDDIWFLIQDSMRLKKNIFEIVIPQLTDENVFTFLTFTSGATDGYVTQMLKEWFNTAQYSKGIFGSQIFAKDSVIQKIKDEWIVPSNKQEDMMMERA